MTTPQPGDPPIILKVDTSKITAEELAELAQHWKSDVRLATRAERFVRGKSVPLLCTIFAGIVLGWGAISAVDWWIAQVLPLWLFVLVTMAAFAASAIWRGWRKAKKP